MSRILFTPLFVALAVVTSVVTINCNKKDTSSPATPETAEAPPAAEPVDSPTTIPADPEPLPSAARQIATQVPAVKAILEKWRLENPGTGERKLHIVYWTPSDREPAPRHNQRLSTILKDIQKYYRKEMRRIGFPNHALKFNHNPDGSVLIHTIKGEKSYGNYNVSSGRQIRSECIPHLKAKGIDPDRETIVIFCNMSVWNEKHRVIRQNSPYYASGTNINGTAWQVDSPILELKSLTDVQNRVRDGQYGNITLGKYNTIFIGGIAHELGHALGLPHNKARPDEAAEFGIALMGNGNRAYGNELRGDGDPAFITLAHGLKLASHPMFSGHTARMSENPQTQISGLAIENHGKSFTCTGTVTGSIPPYAVIAYMDPNGGGDYNATTTTAIPDEDGKFTLECDALVPGDAVLNLVFLHANGRHSSWAGPNSRYSYPYSVDKNGEVDISLAQQTLALTPIVHAFNKRQPISENLIPPTADARTKTIARRLIRSTNQKRQLPAPADVSQEVQEVILTDTSLASAKSGYGPIVFDRSPVGGVLLTAGEKIHPAGVFAHAPSNLTYNLGGKWKTLSGSAGIAPGTPGKAAFIIKGDGRVLFNSNPVPSGKPVDYNVNVENVQTLELIATDGGDTNRSDHTQWLSPVLKR